MLINCNVIYRLTVILLAEFKNKLVIVKNDKVMVFDKPTETPTCL